MAVRVNFLQFGQKAQKPEILLFSACSYQTFTSLWIFLKVYVFIGSSLVEIQWNLF